MARTYMDSTLSTDIISEQLDERASNQVLEYEDLYSFEDSEHEHIVQYIPKNYAWEKTASLTSRNYTYKIKGGLKRPIYSGQEADFLRHYLNAEFLNDICCETTTFYRQRKKQFDPDWYLSPKDLLKFILITMHMPLSRKSEMRLYWRKTKGLHNTKDCAKTMSRDKYFKILSNLHFANNEKKGANGPLYKIGGLLRHLKERTDDIFIPFQKLVIDESLILHKGRLSFKQYISSKRHRFGLKMFVLCDCTTGLVLDNILYIGKGTLGERKEYTKDLGFSGIVVKEPMKPFLKKNHILFTDNWYTSPALADYLSQNDTALCGTVRRVRRNLPKMQGELLLTRFFIHIVIVIE